MSKELSFKEKMKLMQMRHREKALSHSLIAIIILAIPFFGHQWLFSAEAPSNTRPDNVEYRMSMVGDMMLGRHVHDAAVRSGEHVGRTFDYVTPFFQESDYVTGNFESPILDPYHERYDDSDDPDIPDFSTLKSDSELDNKDIHFYAEPWAIEALEKAGFDSVTLANNHALDYGDLSLEDTLEHFADSSIQTLGIGDAINLDEDEIEDGAVDAAEVSFFDINDNTRAGIIGYTEVKTRGFDAREHVGGVLTYEEIGELRSRIENAKLPEEEGGGGADIIIVHVHWGDEYQVGFNEDQEEKAQFLTNYGADIIVGHHSHVLEPITIVEGIDGNKSIVMNSLGNFVFDQGWSRTKESAIAQLDFLDNGSKQLSFVPLHITDTRPKETFGLMKPYQDFRIFRTLRKELENDKWSVQDGRLIIDLDEAGVLEGVDITS
ncbi:CapA family protein [Salipaludibacillus daqingensis]|uniref:CapA family protein n=1 Tax=Salipaludibacillus daqingensis TaxID=3041001 RepID=UPI002475C3C6|nr:CapA family protein [Salipaludibacillus daqingensis]